MKRPRWHTEPDADPSNPSKSQIKRDLIKLQEFGLRLLAIRQDRLDAIAMDDRLREALLDLRRLPAAGRRRQAQYVGKLLREVDLAPFERELPENRRR